MNIAVYWLILLVFVVVVIASLRWLAPHTPEYPLPPGPSADPFIGHVRMVPSDSPWKKYAEWSKTYGHVIYTEMFGRPVVILSNYDDARELLDRRGANYSDRPRMVLIAELMKLDRSLGFLGYGDRFRRQRRLMQQHFNSRAVQSFRATQKYELAHLLNNFLHSPSQFRHHIKRSASKTMIKITYGEDVITEGDRFALVAEEANDTLVATGLPGGTLVDYVPILRHLPAWFPGASFKHNAIQTGRVLRKVIDDPYALVNIKRATGTAPTSLVLQFLEDCDKRGILDLHHEDDMKNVAGGLVAAGVGTTDIVLSTFMLAMVLHPQVAKRAQEEIDKLVGNDRLPDWDDRESLPFVECIFKETVRWNPPAPLGIPHQATNADVFNGLHIPAGSMIIPNIWAMLRDPNLYPDPDTFKPERFLNSPNRPTPYDSTQAVFGFGRRICPGRFFADAGIWLAIARILAAFDLAPACDLSGKPSIPNVAFTSGFTSQPKEYACHITPRSDRAVELICSETVRKFEVDDQNAP